MRSTHPGESCFSLSHGRHSRNWTSAGLASSRMLTHIIATAIACTEATRASRKHSAQTKSMIQAGHVLHNGVGSTPVCWALGSSS